MPETTPDARDRRKPEAAAQSGRSPAIEDKPKPWWQQFLIYPALVIALIGAVPNYWDKYQAWAKGVEQDELKAALRRNALYQDNLECLKVAPQWVETKNRMRVDATICDETGDLVVTYAWGKDFEVRATEFVSKRDLQGHEGRVAKTASGGWLSTAHAAVLPVEIAQAQEQIICQRWLQEGRLLQRLRTAHGTCIDQIVNTYKGMVESRRPAPCDPQC